MALRLVPSLALVALFAAGSSPAPDAEDLARRLVAGRPDTLQALEAVVGPLHRDVDSPGEFSERLERHDPHPAISRLVVDLAIDIYHGDPYDPDPLLAGYRAELRAEPDGEKELLAAVREAIGSAPGFRVGAVDGAVTLRWDRYPPPPEMSDRETEDLVGRIVRTIEGDLTRAAIERHLGALARDPGWKSCDSAEGKGWSIRICPRGAARPDSVQLSFAPTLPGNRVVEALEIEDPILMTIDLHMSSSRIFAGDGSDPRLASWRVSISAEGDDRVRIESPRAASLAWRTRAFRIHGMRFER